MTICPICKRAFPVEAESVLAPLVAHLLTGGGISEFLIQCLLECTDRDRVSLRRADNGYIFRYVVGATTYVTWGATHVEAILKCVNKLP